MQRRACCQTPHDEAEDGAHLLLRVRHGDDVRLGRVVCGCCLFRRPQRSLELSRDPARQGVGSGVAGQADDDGEAAGSGERLQQRLLGRREASRQVDDDVTDVAESEGIGASGISSGESQVLLVVVYLRPSAEIAEEADDVGCPLSLALY